MSSYRHLRALALALVAPLVAALAVGLPAGPAGAAAPPPDLLAQVKALPHVVSAEEKQAPEGYRYFVIGFSQPVDHDHPDQGTFTQRMTLLHKDVSRPMVMYTSGYGVSTTPSRSEPTRIVDGNQISMEYRFFEPSRPAHPKWTKQLTIKQAAEDQHEIIRSFKRLYTAHWLTTGGSKGGMTATYHRRFFPRDVDGTVPYVAPNDVVDTKDVYNDFLDHVGSDQQCRDDLTALQRRVLRNRVWFTDKTRRVSRENHYTYDIVGSLPRAMESAVVDMYFAFWQYSPESDCATVPDARTATNDQVWDFFEAHSSLTTYADQQVSGYTPYYFQAAYQLGSPEPYETRLTKLLRFPGADVAATFVPADIRPKRFDTAAMPDVDHWVRTRSTRMLYVYGSNDPWSAEPFACGKGGAARECERHYVPGGNHGSTIAQLPEAEREHATDLVLRWAGLPSSDEAAKQIARTGAPEREPALDRRADYLVRHGA
ncbi:tripeptidyl aminopeptidase [Marmoricola endophyticus]|uniref:Tripeptidyl aminopeptidase n=1 Tax=Marmoricola endophyticus TaxID=2040280 RepID=A0A917BI70_9ACTN|nr:S28 family serine protease [Marmoricola endophyticus]GGF44290.1 tripeptidyl aminopeptidase [Marmoricola endophyticus]